MIRCIRMLTMSLTAFFLAVWSAPCHAAEAALKEVLTNTLSGGFSGTLVGGAVMAFTNKQGMNLDYMGLGAAGGAVMGAVLGYGKALVEVDNGTIKFTMPTIIPDRTEPNSRGQSAYTFSTQLIRGKF